MRQIANQVNLWENRYEEHATKQLHNPFSKWSGVRPKTPLTSPTGEYPKPPSIYSPRSPSPFEEQPSIFHSQRFNPSGEQSSRPFHPTTFSPQKQPTSPFHPTTFSPQKQPTSPFHPTTFNPPEQPSSPFYPKSFNPREQSPGILSPKSPYPSKQQNPEIISPPIPGESDGQVNFLNRVKKWRKPGCEVEELVPLTKIPEPAKPAEPIKVKVPIPTPWEDPLSGQPFSPPQELNWSGRSQQTPFSPHRAGKPEYLNWRVSPEKECFKINLEKPVKVNEVSKVIPGWTPMGKTFAKIVGGNQTISNDIYTASRQDTKSDTRYPDPIINWDHPSDNTPYYTNQFQESESSDMNYLRQNMSSQINLWQQRAAEHEQKQLLNPFSEWDGASHRAKLSKTDADYGKPIEGSMTEIRGKKAGEHISNEIIELCQIISDLGDLQPDNTVVIKFGALFQAYTRISNKLVGMLMRARKQNLVNFEGEMLFQGRDDDVEIKLLKAVEQRTTESAAGVESENGDEARSSGWVPAEIKISASGEEASTTGASSEDMLSRSESANSANMVMKKGSSICSSSMSNEESSMSMKEESLGSSKMMASSASSSQMMSKEDGEFSTKMFAGSSNTSKMMAKEESSSSTKMFSESSSSMKMLKEEGSLSTQMLGEAVGDGTKMLAGVSISPSVTKEELMGSMKAGDIFNSMKMVPGEGSTFPQQLIPHELGTLNNMSSSEMLSTQQASSTSSSSSMMNSKQMSMTSEQMSSAMENMSMSSEESKQMKMSSSQMSSASEQMSMASEQKSMTSEQMSMSSEQMSSSSSQMKQVSDFSQVSSNDLMSSLMDGKMVSTQGSTSSGSIQKSSQQSSSSQLLSKSVSSFESSSNTALMDETHSLMSSDIQDFKQLT